MMIALYNYCQIDFSRIKNKRQNKYLLSPHANDWRVCCIHSLGLGLGLGLGLEYYG